MKEKIRCLEGASSTLNNVLSMPNNVLSTLNNVLATVCPWFVHGLIFWNMKVTNSYSAQVFPSIFNCGDLYCNCGHLSSRPGQDAKQRPLWVKKHPFCKGRLKNVRGSLGDIFETGINMMVKNSWDFFLFTIKQKPISLNTCERGQPRSLWIQLSGYQLSNIAFARLQLFIAIIPILFIVANLQLAQKLVNLACKDIHHQWQQPQDLKINNHNVPQH